MKWRLAAAIGGFVLCISRPASAVFGEENGPLTAIWAENVMQTKKMVEGLQLARESTDLVRETAGFVKETVQVGKNLVTAVDNPEAFMLYAIHGWSSTFPELQSILENVYDARESLDAAAHPERLPEYDPYAYVRAFDRLKNVHTNRFEVLAHAVDYWGINEPHDEAIARYKVQYEMAMENLKLMGDAINASKLSPVQASIFNAQATTIASAAQVEAAATMHSIARTIELKTWRDEVAKASAAEKEAEFEDAMVNLRISNVRLDPLGKHRVQSPPQ